MDEAPWGHNGSRCRGRGRGFRRAPDTQLIEPVIARESVVQTPAVCNVNVAPEQSVKDKVIEEATSDQESNTETGKSFSDFEPPRLADKIGNAGDRCRCLTNFVKLSKTRSTSVYEYHVNFKPSLESTKVKRSMVKQLEAVIGPVSVFEGHILYLPIKLPHEVHSLNCMHPNSKSTEICVTIKFVKEKTEAEELTQFYNVLFQRVLTLNGFLEIRRGFYKISDVRNIPRERLQVWPGVLLTVEVKDDGLMVMFDSPNRVLRTETLYDFYKSLRDSDRDDTNVREVFSAYVIGKIVVCQYSNQCYKIDDVAWDLNPNSFFNYKENEITYKDYFLKQYNIIIKDDVQPLVVSKIKPRNVAHPSPPIEAVRVIALVPELCHETGLTSEQRSNYHLMTEISGITRLNPRLRMSAMGKLLKEITESHLSQGILSNWGLKLHKQVLDAIGRRISNPPLLFHPSGETKIVPANFSKEACRSCYHSIPVSKFFVLCAHKDLDCAQNFIVQYGEACSMVGIKLRTTGEIIKVNEKSETINPSRFVKALEKACKTSQEAQFVVVILPFNREDLYRAVKKYCLSVNPIPSQCVMAKTLRHRRSIKTIIMNICFQINCKLGGSLWGLQLPQTKKTMILGMDAAHDPSRKHPSVIALVATLNSTCTSYFTRCAYQPIHQEVCTSLRVMFKDALEAYRQYNAGELPDRVIFYRDGGSSGTFEVLKKYEVDICLQVLKEDCSADKAIKFSYLCVAKRIPQRILLLAEGNNVINPPPGTTLDHCITEPYRYDFYIVSQQVQQGTVNPTHYTVLFETDHTKPDVMQKISYAMTYMYYNWQGSIKVPAVIQYAHKLGQLVSRIQTLPNRCMSNNLYFL